ncbi:hypothetical protein TNCT_22081 [Trichonephila clavata]|uniref:RING-type domain-containing protein n=1 Tax=Trichonephila clavata TaxID=2740835 RepID=A0A8X6HZA6_TRICU|nr:hypothetical protein TNCT_22081 [Trichonephila clavata]
MVSTECGHVFHSECLFKWIEDSKTCPECLKPVFCENITKLYFNIAPNDEFDAALAESNIHALKASLEEKDNELESSINKLTELQFQAATVEKVAEVNRQREVYIQYELLCLNREYMSLITLENEVKRLKRENEILFRQIHRHKNICRKDVEEDLHEMHSKVAASIANAASSGFISRRTMFKKKVVPVKDKHSFNPFAE